MARSAAAPSPSQLTHLRPTDAAGFRVMGIAAAGTALGLLLSFIGGAGMWIAGQVLLAAMLVQWFVILHECGHDTLFRTRRYHKVAGRIAAFFTLIPYRSWIRVHGRHHKWTGWQDLDPTTAALVPHTLGTVERAVVNVCWQMWIPIFSVLYRISNYWHLPRLFRLFPRREDRRVMCYDALLLLALYSGILAGLGWMTVVRGAGLALVLSLLLEDLLLLSQHTHVPSNVSHGATVAPFAAIEQEPFTRSLRLPPAASAFVLHFDAHELHHMYPFVPGYHLRRIPYSPGNEVGWWHWVSRAKQLRGEVLLFQNREETGWDL